MSEFFEMKISPQAENNTLNLWTNVKCWASMRVEDLVRLRSM
jgi:hypothetical protein